MFINRYLRAYRAQKNNAAKRGISFSLSFKEWCDFWGEDISRRGNGPDNLQMQRFADSGGYEIGNIRKGTPRQNSKTYSDMHKKRKCGIEHMRLMQRQDVAMLADNCPEPDEFVDDEIHKLGMKSSYNCRYNF